MAEFKSIDDFVNYRGNDGGGGGKKLKAWAKTKGFLNFWLSTRQLPARVWYHNHPELVIRTDRETGKEKRNVWGRQHACPEDEAVLKKQRFRNADGSWENPPLTCGDCRLAMAIRMAIVRGDLRDTDVVFRFEGSDKPEENRVVRAGGFCSFWGRNEKDADGRLREAGVHMNTVYQENALARLFYVLVGVDQDDAASGLQTAVQVQTVGDAAKKLIRDQIMSDGDKGNPVANPYCIQFFYDPLEQQFDKKYGARRMNRFPLTQEIEAMIGAEPPSLERYLKPFNSKALRTQLEAHATPLARKVLDWDAIWNVPKPLVVDDPAEKTASPPPRVLETNRERQAKAPILAPDVEYDDPCDDCKAPMIKGATKCTACGASYADEPEPAKIAVPALPLQQGNPGAEEPLYDDEIPF